MDKVPQVVYRGARLLRVSMCPFRDWRAPHLFAPVAQLDLECHPPKVEVMGSSPIGDINKFLRSVAQPGRASALGAECRRFESGYSDEANLLGVLGFD